MSRAERRRSASPKKRVNWMLWGAVSVLLIGVGSAVLYTQTKGTNVNYADYAFTDDKYAKPSATVNFEEFSDFREHFLLLDQLRIFHGRLQGW